MFILPVGHSKMPGAVPSAEYKDKYWGCMKTAVNLQLMGEVGIIILSMTNYRTRMQNKDLAA